MHFIMPEAVLKSHSLYDKSRPEACVASSKGYFLAFDGLIAQPQRGVLLFLVIPATSPFCYSRESRESIDFLGIGSLRPVDACLRRHDNVW